MDQATLEFVDQETDELDELVEKLHAERVVWDGFERSHSRLGRLVFRSEGDDKIPDCLIEAELFILMRRLATCFPGIRPLLQKRLPELQNFLATCLSDVQWLDRVMAEYEAEHEGSTEGEGAF
jgi:hypothetical protein